jgi:hypothetical protein
VEPTAPAAEEPVTEPEAKGFIARALDAITGSKAKTEELDALRAQLTTAPATNLG